MLDRVDPEFRALPLAALADAALDPRPGPRRPARRHPRGTHRHPDDLAARRGRHRRRRRDLVGLAVRVLVDGVWGFASHVDLTPERAAATAEQAVQVARTLAPVGAGAGGARRRARARRRGLGLRLRARPVRRAHPRQGRPAHRLVAAAARRPTASTTSRPPSPRSASASSTPTSPAPRPIQQRVRIAPAAHRDRRRPRRQAASRPWTPSPPPAGRGWEYLTGDGWDFERRARRPPRAARREGQGAQRRRGPATTWSSTRPTCGSPSTSRSGTPPSTTAPSATRPPTRAPASPPPTSSARCATAPTLMHVTGDRTIDHGLATVGFDDDGVATTEWDLVRDGVLVGYQLDRTFAPRLGLARSQRLRVRRLPAPRADPADGQRLAATRPGRRRHHRRPDRGRRARHLRRRRQVLVDRHAALQLPVHRPALLPDRERRGSPGSCATSPTRRPPRTSGARSTASAGRRPGCSAAR